MAHLGKGNHHGRALRWGLDLEWAEVGTDWGPSESEDMGAVGDHRVFVCVK